MACYSPVQGWKAGVVNPSGKRSVVFSPKGGFVDLPVLLPCGKCVGCFRERARQWAVRCMHEAQLHEANCFLTLTYDDDHLPSDGSLVKRDFQLFMKRLRKFVRSRISFYMAGEYGSRDGRPHYHCLVFGYDFPDKVFLRRSSAGSDLYRSASLEKLWTLGFSSIGAVTFKSAYYVAKYCLKKLDGMKAPELVVGFDQRTGEVFERQPEFSLMSLRPAIGRDWYDKYWLEVGQGDSVVVGGKEARPPRYYDKLLEEFYADERKRVKYSRIAAAAPFKKDATPERLRVREEVARARVKLYKGSL